MKFVCGVVALASSSLVAVLVRADDLLLNFTASDVRVQALSSTLLRIEPKGPLGFEDRTTFSVYDRASFGSGVALKLINQTNTEAFVGTDDYTLHLEVTDSLAIGGSCTAHSNTDVTGPERSTNFPNGAKVDASQDCCNSCQSDESCIAWVHVSRTSENSTLGDGLQDVPGANCWPLSGFSEMRQGSDRETGCLEPGCSGFISIVKEATVISNKDGSVAWQLSQAKADQSYLGNLNWPAPSAKVSGYAFEDRPRFFAPEWGPTPIPSSAKVDPTLVKTNGYDFRNDVGGDVYIFLFPKEDGLDAWHYARQQFLQLTGPVPLLPDYAYGTWFTYWHQYTEDEAKEEIVRWSTDDLPIDIWALDMNWRNSPNGHQKNPPYQQGDNHVYNKPNTELFPDFANNGTFWFDWLKSQGLRTYFNDHPFPADDGKAYQTTADEVNFRHDGLTHWMDKGLTFWWFDANWAFSIPPPQVPYGGSGDGPTWEGMTNRVWGSHVYHTTARIYDQNHPTREHTAAAQRPMSLTKYADANMHPGLVQHQHVAHHRYPVWWTGDGVDLQASVQSMVDSGVYDLKPYVHSDCGGDYRGKVGGDLIRWASHCTFGTILRFHGNEHQPWSYDTATEDSIRTYLKMRYKMMPMLISAGQTATQTGFPIVVRCDIMYPNHTAAASNEQYLHLNDTLVAPIWDSSTNETSRTVWIPPAQWQDAWSGSTVTGPQTLTVTQPYEKIPLWHRVGGMLVTLTDNSALRVDKQNWNNLTIEAFVPDFVDISQLDTEIITAIRYIYAQKSDTPSFKVEFVNYRSKVAVRVTPLEAARDYQAQTQTWVVRLHLRNGQEAHAVVVDNDTEIKQVNTLHILPLAEEEMYTFTPFAGQGSAPAAGAGAVVEIKLAAAEPTAARSVEVTIGKLS